MKLNKKTFLIYKLFNSAFTGLSIGILFTIYQPIESPSIYSIGGMALAIGMLILARFYDKLLNIKNFLRISILVEIIILITLFIFLSLQQSITSALLIYCGYQLTFIFGGYLVRAETLVAREKGFLGKIDINKQVGYLVGLASSFGFYKSLELGFEISNSMTQIRILHYLLICLQSVIIVLLLRSFEKNENIF
jgi:hypothetical protein